MKLKLGSGQKDKMTQNANIPKNAKYIDYKCIKCDKNIDEDERQKIILLGCVQTWCLLCIVKLYPSDRNLADLIKHGGTIIFDRNNLFTKL